MARAKVVKVIYTEETRGKGTEKDPVQIVPQFWTMDGELICEAEYALARAYQDTMRKVGNSG